jgi:AcrR family transcriptional regulator
MTGSKQRLLERTVEYLAANGARDVSLRQLAAALGTSHRMLLYHFGSKEGLLIEVVRTMEQRQRENFAALDPDFATSPTEVARRFWRQLADPARWPYERLFFELYGWALQGEPGATPLLEGIIEHWLAPLTEWTHRQGAPPQAARTTARLGLAVARGLLLDLLATGDREAVDAAMDHFIAIALTTPPSLPRYGGISGQTGPP